MTLSDYIKYNLDSEASDQQSEERDINELAFVLRQEERSSVIPYTTYAQKVIVSKSGLYDTPNERLSNNEIDDKFIQWIGRVLEIDGDLFTAKIDPIRHRTTSKIVRFNVNKVIILNEEHMKEGATFYWTIGLFRNQEGTFVKRSEIRFRLPIIPNREAIDEIALFKAENLFEGIGWLE